MKLEKGACASLDVEENGKCSIKTNHSPVNEAKISESCTRCGDPMLSAGKTSGGL